MDFALTMPDRIVITGVGLTSPLGDSLAELRAGLLSGRPRIETWRPRHFAEDLPAGRCHFPVGKHQSKKDARRGTRAGQIAIYCGREALADAGFDLSEPAFDRSRLGVMIGITEHGNAEFEHEWANLQEYGNNVAYWSHHHNPRTVANNPAGELCLNLGATGPHMCLGAACAAGNSGLIAAAHRLRLREIDAALAGGVSEALHFGIYASFNAQNALARHPDPNRASRPFDKARNGIVIAEGGCLFVLERMADALAREAHIYAELAGWAENTDATDFVLPNARRQAECMALALRRAGLGPEDVDLVSCHATATPEGDPKEIEALRQVFGPGGPRAVNASKGFFGHAMGAAAALELAGNLGLFDPADGRVHPCANVDELDPACALPGLVLDAPRALDLANRRGVMVNNSFGMLGINAVTVATRVERP